MFTGIVEELGRIESFEQGRLRVGASVVLEDVALGDSIAVNGCCLTVVEHGPGWWIADVSDETVRRTSLASARPGDPVNLERAVRVETRLGGHLVQGHVDAVGEIVDPVPDLRVRVPAHLTRYLVEKGSVTVDGVSLTVVEPLPDGFTVAIIPHTAAVTTHTVRDLLAKIEEDRKRQSGDGAKVQDKILDKQGTLIATQIKANEALERFVFAGVGPAQSAMIKLAEA
ncbi:MAG: riboflavin synthase, partial [Ilumatobacteraceae bacterium]